MPPSRVVVVLGLTHPRASRRKVSRTRDAARGNACGRSRVESRERTFANAQSRSRTASRRRHHRRALYAADAAYSAGGIGRPDQQGAAGDDRGWLRAVVLRGCAGAERDHPRVRFRSQRAAQRRRHPARRLWPLDAVARAVRAAGEPVWRLYRRRRDKPGRARRLRARHHAGSGLDALRRTCAGLDPDRRSRPRRIPRGRARCSSPTPSARRSRCLRLPMAGRP